MEGRPSPGLFQICGWYDILYAPQQCLQRVVHDANLLPQDWVGPDASRLVTFMSSSFPRDGHNIMDETAPESYAMCMISNIPRQSYALRIYP